MRRPATGVLGLVAVAAVMTFAACDSGTGDGGPGNTPGQSAEVVANVTLTEESEPQPFVVREGRYRLSWRHTCDEIGVLLQQGDGTEVFNETSVSKNFSKFLFDVEAGEYELRQTNEACTDYEIQFNRM